MGVVAPEKMVHLLQGLRVILALLVPEGDFQTLFGMGIPESEKGIRKGAGFRVCPLRRPGQEQKCRNKGPTEK